MAYLFMGLQISGDLQILSLVGYFAGHCFLSRYL